VASPDVSTPASVSPEVLASPASRIGCANTSPQPTRMSGPRAFHAVHPDVMALQREA
jgi:hypothetical protein